MTNKVERENIQLIITTIISILLAIAFISQYEIAKKGADVEINQLIIKLFILGGLAILCLSFIYVVNNKWNLLWIGYISLIPFILMFFYLFTRILYNSITSGSNMGSGFVGFISSSLELLWRLSVSYSTIVILFIMIIVLIVYFIIKLNKSNIRF